MERIDIYIQEVIRRLPEKSRGDIEMELRSTILDMMPDAYTESDVDIALTQLGEPAKLANQYRDRQNFLIGPKFFESYITILKISLSIAVLVSLIVTVVDQVIKFTDDITLLEAGISFITSFLGIIIQALMNVFCWVTIIFAILDRIVDDASMKTKKWTPEDLKYILPIEPKNQISKAEIFLGLFWTAIWATMYFKASELLGIYEKSESDNKLIFVEPLFNQEVLLSFWPIIAVFIIIEVGLTLHKWMVGRWTNNMAVLNTIYHIAFFIFTIVLINQANLFNMDFIEYLGDLFNVKQGNVQNYWSKGIYGVVLIIFITSVLDSIEGFRKAKKSEHRAESNYTY